MTLYIHYLFLTIIIWFDTLLSTDILQARMSSVCLMSMHWNKLLTLKSSYTVSLPTNTYICLLCCIHYFCESLQTFCYTAIDILSKKQQTLLSKIYTALSSLMPPTVWTWSMKAYWRFIAETKTPKWKTVFLTYLMFDLLTLKPNSPPLSQDARLKKLGTIYWCMLWKQHQRWMAWMHNANTYRWHKKENTSGTSYYGQRHGRLISEDIKIMMHRYTKFTVQKWYLMASA